MHYRSFLAMSAAAVLAATTTVFAAGTSSATAPPVVQQDSSPAPVGSFALSGQEARDFTLPGGMEELHTATFPDGRTSTRYQQMVDGATVFGGQITVIREASGQADTVIGAYFPGLKPKNDVKISRGKAKGIAQSKIGTHGDFSNELRIDPRNGRLFYEVESIRRAERPVRWIDAGSGRVNKAFDKLAHGEGVGVKGDTKTIDTTQNAESGLFDLHSADGRQITFDGENAKGQRFDPILMTDDDDVWDLVQGPGSPSQAAGVDAHYYAGVVDDFYAATFGRDSIDDAGMQIISLVHYGKRYCNAFWNGAYMTYGDGDGTSCLPLSGGLDVDGHELTHGVTDFTSDLIYENESGALNEAFSDMMGNTIEFYADEHNLDPAAEPDFRIGEDVINPATPARAGFRNMGDPGEFGDPDHVVDQYTGAEDGGGVHTNSGIANHAYYLTANGGQNAGCTATALRPATHTEDCNVTVTAVGLDEAAQVYYEAFTALPEYANFCDARNATTAVAKNNRAFGAAWDAVGVHADCTEGTPPPPPCVSDATAALPIESDHPYGHNGDCTWTFDNGAAGFSFHFSMLDMEKDYDYVYVKDGNGQTLATYTGTAKRGFDSPCISTSTGSIQMVTDPAVDGQGFIVDAVTPC